MRLLRNAAIALLGLFGALVTNAALALSVSMTAPANNSVFGAGTNITLSANATPTNRNRPITKVDFYRGGTTLIGTASSSPYSVVWTNAAAGTYSITAKATDSSGATATSSAITVIVDALPSVSLDSPANGAVFTSGSTISLAATAADSDGTVSRVDFYQGSTLLGTATSSPYTFSWSSVPAGTYSLTAKATDNRGFATTSTAVTIKLDSPPTVTLTAPSDGAAFAPGSAVTITATAADSDGTVSKVDFYQGTTLLGTATSAPYTFAWTNPPSGTYSLTAKATDNDGVVTTSTAVSIRVDSAPAVSVTAPSDGAVFSPGSTINLAASASDSDGTISKVDFYQGTTLLGTATSAPYTFAWTNAASGTYSLTAQATDSDGAVTTSGAVSIRVDSAPVVSLTAPTDGAQFSGGSTIVLSAAASDSDGTVSKVDFYQGTTLLGTVTSAPYTFAWTNAAQGSYSLTAQATDNDGGTTTSTAISIAVSAARAAGIYFIQTDHLNTPRLITDSTGTAVWRWNQDEPFADSVPDNNPSGTGPFDFPERLPGQYFDAETNLHYNYFRDYDPGNGRYAESDLIGFLGGLNTYAYIRGNPTSRIDPYGLWDVFGFGALTGGPDGPIRPAGEAIGLGGYNSNSGWYGGDILATGLEVGGQQNYVAAFEGREVTTACSSPKKIELKEISIGLEIPFLAGFGGGGGRYSTADDAGWFFFLGGGAIGQHGSLGFGFSTRH